MKRRILIVAAPLVLGIGAPAQAATVTDLGPTSAYTWSAVNEAGQVAGTEFIPGTPPQIFAARFSGGVTTRVGALNSGAAAIDGTGRLFGAVSLPAAKYPAWWDAANGEHALPGLPSEAIRFSSASENGTAVGYAAGGPFRQSPSNAFEGLPFGVNARPAAVNNAGHVVYQDGATFFWNGQTSTQLPISVSGGGASFIATNDDVVGSALPGSVPTVWHVDGTTTPLATVPDAPQFVNATGINDNGIVVGTATYPSPVGFRAVIWQDDAVHYLDELFPAGSGWTATSAIDVSNSGIVLGVGQLGGVTKSFLLNLEVCSSSIGKSANSTRAAGCGADGIDWILPPRLKNELTTQAAHGTYGAARLSYVYPVKWHASVFLTANQQPFAKATECANPNVQWRWTVKQTALLVKKPPPGCNTAFDVKKLGKYDLTAKRYERTGPKAAWIYSREFFRRQIEVKDWVIVGMGDSNGSGEANPDWIYKRCNRSLASYQFQTALFLETHDPHSSVTFIFTSCSGARIQHLVSRPFEGTRSQTPPLPPQLDQVHTLLTPPTKIIAKRRVDAALISIGVNDLSFGAVGNYCVFHPALPTDLLAHGCENDKVKYVVDLAENKYEFIQNPKSTRTLTRQVNVLQNQLLDRYRALRTRLGQPYASNRGLGIPMRKVFLTPYPDFSTDEFGNTCDTSGFRSSFIRWNAGTWAWFGLQARALNRRVRLSGLKYKWQVSPLSDTAFSGHGYCAGGAPTFSASFIRGAILANASDDKAGPLHPTADGHLLEAAAQSGQLCETLYFSASCEGKWR